MLFITFHDLKAIRERSKQFQTKRLHIHEAFRAGVSVMECYWHTQQMAIKKDKGAIDKRCADQFIFH